MTRVEITRVSRIRKENQSKPKEEKSNEKNE